MNTMLYNCISINTLCVITLLSRRPVRRERVLAEARASNNNNNDNNSNNNNSSNNIASRKTDSFLASAMYS